MYVDLNFSTGQNWTPLEVPLHLEGTCNHAACCVAVAPGQEHPLLLVAGGYKGGKAFKDMWVLDVDRRAWSKVSNLVNDELHQKWFLLHILVHLVACPGSEIKTVAH